MHFALPKSHLAYLTAFHFELPWPSQSPIEVIARNIEFMASAEKWKEAQLIGVNPRELVANPTYRIHLPYWPEGNATAIVRLGFLKDTKTHGITVKLDLEHCFLDDAEFLIDLLEEIVGPDLASMRTNATITKLGATVDLDDCHMMQLGLSGTDDRVKFLEGTMPRNAPAAIAKAGLVPGAITVAQVSGSQAPIVRIRTLQSLRLPIAKLGAHPNPLRRLKFDSPSLESDRSNKARLESSCWQWEPDNFWNDILWNIHYTTIFSATDCNLKAVRIE